MLAALVVLIMIVVTNLSALFFCCYATDYYGLWLQTFHRKDLYCLRILVRHVISLIVMVNCFLSVHCVPYVFISVFVYVEMSRSTMVWLCTLHGLLSPLLSTSHWFSICGVCPGALQLQPLCASCLER